MEIKKTLYILAFALVFAIDKPIFGQTEFGLSCSPGYSGAFVTATSSFRNYSRQSFSDSIKKDQEMFFSPGFGAFFVKKSGRFDQIYVGLQYQSYGWGRRKKDLKFLSPIHDDVGKVLDLSQSVEKDVAFTFKFHQIVVPFYFLTPIRIKRMPVGLTISAFFGGGLHVTFMQKNTAKTISFKAYDKKVFNLPSENFDGSPLNISAQTGLRMTSNLGNGYLFSFMPGISFLPIPSRNQYERQFQYRGQIELGISKFFK